MRRLVLIFLLGLLGAGTAVLWHAYGWAREPLAIKGSGLSLVVAERAPLRTVAEELARREVLAHPAYLVALGRLTGQASRIRAGEYWIERGTAPLQLMEQLVGGKVQLHKVTLVEGWTARQILAAIQSHKAVRRTLPASSPQDLARALKLERASAEGLFLPETYHFSRGTTDLEILEMAHQAMVSQVQRAWSSRQQGLPLASDYELLILASIIERETGLQRERPAIAGVFVRRLLQGMRLQTDPTVIYGIGPDFDGNLTRADLQRDTPWNTYTRSGLPPTPIASPGAAALAAAAHPAPGNSLYFVASPARDGSHQFSATLAEHNAAVRRYLAAAR
jgi:UPF0755 protein